MKWRRLMWSSGTVPPFAFVPRRSVTWRHCSSFSNPSPLRASTIGFSAFRRRQWTAFAAWPPWMELPEHHSSWSRPATSSPLPASIAIRTIVDRIVARGGGWASAEEALGMLSAAGVESAASRVVRTDQDAVNAATAIG